MEANVCDINHLDADVLLPPRKRLLAGFKKQNSDGDAALTPPAVASSSSSASPSSSSPPYPTPSSPSSSEYQARLNNLLSSHFNNNHNLSPELIVQASKSAANAALKAAEAARAAAQEKAIIAAKAVTAAKSALALVASFPEEAASKERNLKKNKLKKHVQVQLLYKKHQPVENYRDDEELARKLHRVINSSPRISKNSSSSDWKGHKNKKLKSSSASERTRTSNGSVAVGGEPSSMCNGHDVAGELDSEGSIGEVCTSMADEKIFKYERAAQLEINNEEVESSHAKEKILGDAGSPSKRRGRLKLKKLPLSICSSRDQANPNPKDDIITRSSPLTDKNMGNPTTCNKPLFSMEPSADNMIPVEVAPMRKCQEFKSPACIKQSNKVIQS